MFEAIIHDVLTDPRRIIVAAAGNAGATELAFPARFHNIAAILGINQHRSLAHFTNRGNVDENDRQHPNVFVSPSGDYAPDGSVTEEDLAESADGTTKYYGTSFAAAYATAVIAAHARALRDQGLPSDRDDVLASVRNRADTDASWYSPIDHGNGLLQAP